MIDATWRIQDEDGDADLMGAPRPLMGTWHYLRNSLRRDWRTWASMMGKLCTEKDWPVSGRMPKFSTESRASGRLCHSR